MTKWSVDIDRMAIETFQVNNPKSVGFVHGTDEFLYLLRRWDALCKELEDFTPPPAKKGKGSQATQTLLDVRPKPAAPQRAEEEATGAGGKAKKGRKRKAKDEDEDEDEAEEFREAVCEELLQFLVKGVGGQHDEW